MQTQTSFLQIYRSPSLLHKDLHVGSLHFYLCCGILEKNILLMHTQNYMVEMFKCLGTRGGWGRRRRRSPHSRSPRTDTGSRWPADHWRWRLLWCRGQCPWEHPARQCCQYPQSWQRIPTLWQPQSRVGKVDSAPWPCKPRHVSDVWQCLHTGPLDPLG